MSGVGKIGSSIPKASQNIARYKKHLSQIKDKALAGGSISFNFPVFRNPFKSIYK